MSRNSELEDIIEVGRAQGPVVKGEDTLYVRFGGPTHERQLCAAVFDGHGGKAASAAALKTVGDRLMDHGPPFSDAHRQASMDKRKCSTLRAATPAHSAAPWPESPRVQAHQEPTRSPRDCDGALLPAQRRQHRTAFDHLQADAFWQADQAPGWVHIPPTCPPPRDPPYIPVTCASRSRRQRATHDLVGPHPLYLTITGARRGGRDVGHHRDGLLPRAVRRRAGGRVVMCHEFEQAVETKAAAGPSLNREAWVGPLSTHPPASRGQHGGLAKHTQARWRGWATRPLSTSTWTQA